MTDRITLYGNPESGHTYKVKLYLDSNEIKHEYKVVDIFTARNEREEPFCGLSLKKFGEVPLLTCGEMVYAQSNSILLFLSEKFNIGCGDSLTEKNEVREWLFWEANKIGLSLPHLRLARSYFPEDFPEGSVEWLQMRFDFDVNVLNEQLSDGRQFIIGDSITIADYSICGYMFFANHAKVNLPKYVKSWLIRIQQLPNWRPPFELLSTEPNYQTFGVIKDHYLPNALS